MTQSRYFCWTQGHSARFLTVHDSSMQMRFVSAKLGQTTVDDSSRDMSAAEIAQNIEQALRHGFREVSETEFANEQAQIKTHFELLTLEQAPPRAMIARWQDLKSEFKHYLCNDPEEYLPRNLQSFCVYDEPCRLDSSLELAIDSNGPTAQTAQRNLIFRQGLVIDGNLDAGGFITELPQLLIIQGDLCAKNLILTGWAEVIVTGNVKLEGVLLAYDGEAGGRLKVHGNLTAQRVLGGMMYNIEVAGRTEGRSVLDG